MGNQIAIVGYEQESNCEHCGRSLKHGIRISDGRVVGAMCLNNQLTKPKEYQGKKFRLGAELIVRAAKVAQFYAPAQWGRFGVSNSTLTFEVV